MRNYLKYTFMLLAFTTQAQYIDVSVDPNKLFGILDNSRTEVDHQGLDFDVEIGALTGRFSAYAFYGRFENAGYQNYGAGTDYYLAKGDRYDISLGPAVSMVLRKVTFEDTVRGWAAYMAYHFRLNGVFWALPKLGISATAKYQRRPDIGTGIFEGSIGLRYKLK